MKIRPEQLSQVLSKQPLPKLFILSGDEPLLTEELAKKIYVHAKSQGFEQLTRLTVDNSFHWDQFLLETQNLSLLATKQTILLRLTAWKFDTQAKAALTQYAQGDNPHNIVIIIGPKLDTATQNTKWFKAIAEQAIMIPVWPIDARQLPSWIAQRAKQEGISITLEQAQLIAERTEGNLLAAQQELLKLSLLDESPISNDTIEALVSFNAQYDIFKLVDYCLAGDLPHIAKVLNNLQQKAAEPILLTWALAKELRLINQVISYQKQNISVKLAAQKLRIWDKKIPFVNKYLSQNDEKSCQRQLQQLGNIDRMIKGDQLGDVWQQLHLLCTDIAGTQVIKDAIE